MIENTITWKRTGSLNLKGGTASSPLVTPLPFGPQSPPTRLVHAGGSPVSWSADDGKSGTLNEGDVLELRTATDFRTEPTCGATLSVERAA